MNNLNIHLYNFVYCNQKSLPGTDQNIVSVPQQSFKVIRVCVVTRKYPTVFGH